MSNSSPARTYALVVGATLLVAGIIGFFYNSSFTTDEGDRDAVLGLLDVNGFHNVVHLLSGLVGLMAYRAGAAASRTYALVFGVVYLLVAVWGFVIGDGESILSIIPVNTEDNILHVLIALAGLGAYAASKTDADTGRSTTATA